MSALSTPPPIDWAKWGEDFGAGLSTISVAAHAMAVVTFLATGKEDAARAHLTDMDGGALVRLPALAAALTRLVNDEIAKRNSAPPGGAFVAAMG